MNLKWYLDKLKNQSDTIKKNKSDLSIDAIEINNARFSFINKNALRARQMNGF